ncbi:hypothetical protein PPYR_05083 [Photinus pyralis]|uniref:Uncharacterized protein n=1 Tax=Photinus pyralis TaxID=7054 RepID=A0A5N4AZW7_PHOPY|nr:hypothetical protein PPYR_05083 [Photinus pyralis]
MAQRITHVYREAVIVLVFTVDNMSASDLDKNLRLAFKLKRVLFTRSRRKAGQKTNRTLKTQRSLYWNTQSKTHQGEFGESSTAPTTLASSDRASTEAKGKVSAQVKDSGRNRKRDVPPYSRHPPGGRMGDKK